MQVLMFERKKSILSHRELNYIKMLEVNVYKQWAV
jgi:hypothetical protein